MCISLRWVPHEPTPEILSARSRDCANIPIKLSEFGQTSQNQVITGDQSWIFLRNEPAHDCGSANLETPVSVKRTQGKQKAMLTVLFSRKGILVIDFLPIDQRFDLEHLIIVVLPALIAKIKKTRPIKCARGWLIHLDNFTAHNSHETVSICVVP